MHGESSHEISVIDPVKKEVVDVIDTKPVLSPHGMWLDERRDLLWVSYEECEDEKGEGGVGGGEFGDEKYCEEGGEWDEDACEFVYC